MPTTIDEVANHPATSARPAVKYLNDTTGETWTGRGLKPRWLRAAASRTDTHDEGSPDANQ